MIPRTARNPLLLAALAALLLLADFSPQAPLGFSLVRESAAIVGAPLTPVSVAGVARRTTRRVVAVGATATTAAVATSTAVAASSAAAAQQSAVTQQQAATAAQQQAVAQQQAATARQQAAVTQQQAAGAPATGTVVAALPPGCQGTTRNGVEYYQCAGAYYRAAFQGNNLVYVVQQP